MTEVKQPQEDDPSEQTLTGFDMATQELASSQTPWFATGRLISDLIPDQDHHDSCM